RPEARRSPGPKAKWICTVDPRFRRFLRDSFFCDGYPSRPQSAVILRPVRCSRSLLPYKLSSGIAGLLDPRSLSFLFFRLFFFVETPSEALETQFSRKFSRLFLYIYLLLLRNLPADYQGITPLALPPLVRACNHVARPVCGAVLRVASPA